MSNKFQDLFRSPKVFVLKFFSDTFQLSFTLGTLTINFEQYTSDQIKLILSTYFFQTNYLVFSFIMESNDAKMDAIFQEQEIVPAKNPMKKQWYRVELDF